MVNKCVVPGCKSGYDFSDNPSSFRFPFKRADLMPEWKQFVNRPNWTPSSNSVICCKHFDKKFIFDGEKRKKLKWNLDPIPTIRTSNALLSKQVCVDLIQRYEVVYAGLCGRRKPVHIRYMPYLFEFSFRC